MQRKSFIDVRRWLMNVGKCAVAAIVITMFARPTFAQTPPAGAPVRTPLAQAQLSSVVEKPMNFRVLNLTLKAGQKQPLSNAASVVYQVSGTADVTVGSQTTAVATGAAQYVAAGSAATVTAKADSNAIVFQLMAADAKGSESG